MREEDSFLGHLETLRWHLLRSLLAVSLLTVLAFLSKQLLFHHLLLAPTRPSFWTYAQLCELGRHLGVTRLCMDSFPFVLQNRTLTGQFFMHLTASGVAGFVLASPYVFWELWSFVRPGLFPKEQHKARGAAFFMTLLFLLGILFGYFVLSPVAFYFLVHYQVDPSIHNEFDLSSYLSTVLTLLVACGLLFQLPVLVYFLTQAGLLSAFLLRSYRKYAFVVLLILSAMITPPDPFSQVMVVIPLLLLYQTGIWLAARVERKKRYVQGAD